MRAGDYIAQAKEVRDLGDSLVENYPAARDARRNQFQMSESVDLAAKLASGRAITRDDLSKIAEFGSKYAPQMSKAYAGELATRLGNTPNKPGAANILDAINPNKAAQTILGDKADDFLKRVWAEKQFAETARALGGSNTANKISDIKRLMQEGGIAGGLGAADYYVGTGTGLGGLALAGGRKGIQQFIERSKDKRTRELAPILAQALMARQIPAKAPTVAERIGSAKADPRLPLIATMLGYQLSASGNGRQ